MKKEFENPVTLNIKDRRTTRRYTDRQVSAELLEAVIDCGLAAPSARNTQSTIAVACQNVELLEELNRDIENFPGISMKVIDGVAQGFCYNNSSFVFLYAEKDNSWSEINAALVLGNMCLAADSLGLGSCTIGMMRNFMNSDQGKVWRERLGVPDNYDFVCGLTIGYSKKREPAPERREGRLIWAK